MPETRPSALLTRGEISEIAEAHIRHPWNPKSDVYIKRLSAAAGLARVALSLVRIPPHKESFIYHRHEHDEEFIYILSGRGRAEIGNDAFDVGPGDFMGFPAPDGPAHHLLNPYEEDLVYLMGGESSGFDIGHYPRERKHIIFHGKDIRAVDGVSVTRMNFKDWLVRDPDQDA